MMILHSLGYSSLMMVNVTECSKKITQVSSQYVSAGLIATDDYTHTGVKKFLQVCY